MIRDNEGGGSSLVESAPPDPEYLVKSIAEQGYSLETSLADLIDNSITAGADCVEILVDTATTPFTLFVADNGAGMSDERLSRSMQFPSSSPEFSRDASDLGRFGLGMKTASFAQTRKLTVLSRQRSGDVYSARTWDVEYLKQTRKWLIQINTPEEIQNLLDRYESLSSGYLNRFDQFRPGTIVAWQGLYKFENLPSSQDRIEALKHQISEVTTGYLSLIFHRFLDRIPRPLRVRVNNVQLRSFNPFPLTETDLRPLEPRQRAYNNDLIKIQGFVLPVRSMDESREQKNIWTPPGRSLMDMEGLYIYRSDRLIHFGGWNGIIRKSPRLQLARLRVEVGNKVDDLLHLNVAKSQITVPFDLKRAFFNYISILRSEAEKEYHNRGIRKISSSPADQHPQLFERIISNKGALLEINKDFPLVRLIREKLDQPTASTFKLLLRMINTSVNSFRHMQDENDRLIQRDQQDTVDTLEETVRELLASGYSKLAIKTSVIPALGVRQDNIPSNIIKLLE
ncbi:ATP-binding protein [Larkinella rosea]|uniref:ATP-binding protein n=1 Tax=Larkinella rosea TaxID=2025312 RepID=A0A3P1C0C5_9BACT|nr:ATP-binding protein [Larkinella rosea]RRB06855.1 ATP-binding protein [Larkinella rosea]